MALLQQGHLERLSRPVVSIFSTSMILKGHALPRAERSAKGSLLFTPYRRLQRHAYGLWLSAQLIKYSDPNGLSSELMICNESLETSCTRENRYVQGIQGK